MALNLTSTRLQEGGTIPKKYTCDGKDISIPLSWTDPPEGTKSYALIADDPDAPSGTWVHWVLYDLPGDARELPESVPTDRVLASGAKQGVNDFRRMGYGGPCPQPGSAHRYVFTLYALNRVLGLEPGSRKHELLREMKGHILAQAQWTGVYER